MPVHKRGERWHVRVQIDGRRVSRTAGRGATRAEAITLEARIVAELTDGQNGPRQQRTIDDALAHWLTGEARNLKSLANLAGKVERIKRHTFGRRIEEIADVAQELKRYCLSSGLRPATINRLLAILRRVANLAFVQWGWLDSAIGKRIVLLPGERAREVYLSVDQVEQLASSCGDSRVAAAIRLAARTGLRESEILAADTIVDGCIVVSSGTSKNSRPRRVPVPSDMSDLVLPIGITYHQLRHGFESARAAVGLPHVWFHDLRHTAASWWIASGASLPVVRDLLGHCNLSVTSRYLHLMTGDLQRGSDALARFIVSGTKTAQGEAGP